MMHLSKIIIFCSLLLCCFASIPQKQSQYERHQLEKKIKFEKYLSSKEASSWERSDFIKSGLLNTVEYEGYPVSSKPVGAGEDFDCKIKELAFKFAKQLNLGKEVENSVFEGLELGALCNQTFNASAHFHHNVEQIKNSEKHENSIFIFIDNSQENRNILRDGSFKKPFINIQDGIQKCKDVRNPLNKDLHCTIKVRKGIYRINEAIKVKTSNIKIESFDKEQAIVTSDKVVIPEWQLHEDSFEYYEGFNPMFEGSNPKQSNGAVKYIASFTDPMMCRNYCTQTEGCTSYAHFDKTCGSFSNLCYARFDGMWNPVKHTGVTSGKKVLIYKADLSHESLQKVDQIFINNRRAVRARYPNANPETTGLHTVPTGYVGSAEKWLPPHPTDPAIEIQIQTPTREASLFPAFGIGIGGPVSQFEPPQSYWGTKNPFGGGGSTYKVPSGLQYAEDLEINKRTWKNPSTGIIHAFQDLHWGNWMYKLDGRNETSRQLLWSWGGFQEARGSFKGGQWYVENIFEELDVANEWFYNEDTNILYYSPNTTHKDLPEQISIPQAVSLFMCIGVQDDPVYNVTVTGIHFAHTTQTFLEQYMVPSGGDWSVHPYGMLYLEGTEYITVQNCTFDSPGGNGIFVYKYNRETVLANNVLYRLGDNGIVLVGDSHLIDGSQGEQPRGVQVVNNVVFENGIWGKQTYPFVQSRSCETNVNGNIFFNGPRAGININDGFGGGNEINNNLLFNFVRETDDHGPINTWDRVPYLTKVYDGKKLSLNVKENQIHRNFIINNYRSVWPIDHDDGTCFWNDTYNYLVYGGFKNYLGHDKHSMYNTYVYPDVHVGKGASSSVKYCVQSDGQSLGTSGYGDIYGNNKCIMKRSDVYRLGSCSTTYIRELIPYLSNNDYYTTNGTITVKCGSETWNLHEFQMHGMEIGTKINHLVDDDVVIGWGEQLFRM